MLIKLIIQVLRDLIFIRGQIAMNKFELVCNMQRSAIGLWKIIAVFSTVVATFFLSISLANAAPPCDFKGISVGDHATPQQIMTHFGISNYKKTGLQLSSQQFDNRLKRGKVVSLVVALEEEQLEYGPYCDRMSCTIPYGMVKIGEEPYPIQVGVLVSFSSNEKITSIDIIYDKFDWDQVLLMLNEKYGNDWGKREFQNNVVDYHTKESKITTVTVLTHRSLGINQKMGNKCSIITNSQDIIFQHTTPPAYRAIMEIKLVSHNI